MEHIQRLYSLVKRGRDGRNKGLPMGLPKFEDIVDGIQRSTYTCLAGGTGSGKTTFALYAYVYRPIVDQMAKGSHNLRILYYSLEMSAEILLAKLLGLHLYETYGVILSYKQIISKKDTLSDADYELVLAEQGWLEQVLTYLHIYDKPIGADGLWHNLMEHSEAHGEWDEDDFNSSYTSTNEDEVVQIIIDHMGLLRKSKGRSKKEEMDLASSYLMHFRNKCRYSPLALFQLNRTSSSMDRRNAGFQEIQLDDIKDTSGPSEDAEIVIGIFNPYREKVATYKGHNVETLKDKIRGIQVLKNRLGEADKSISVNFFGNIGYWRELPAPEELRRLSAKQMEKYLRLAADDSLEEVDDVEGDGPITYVF